MTYAGDDPPEVELLVTSSSLPELVEKRIAGIGLQLAEAVLQGLGAQLVELLARLID